MNQDLSQIAALLRTAQETRVPCAPVRELIPDGTLDQAYLIQEINTKCWLEAGRRLVGRKIGLTSKAVQAQLGVDQPDYGMLFADMAYVDGEDIPIDRVMQPRIEAEVALVLERDLRHGRHTIADVVSAVAYALPALEVVGSRIAGWNIQITDTIADNASSGVFILGTTPHKLIDVNLAACAMTMERCGELVATGTGRACLGNPLNAARWLADVMVAAGRPLQAGDIVLSGALGVMTQVEGGDVIDCRISGLGELRASFV